jgi:hypothetical protein
LWLLRLGTAAVRYIALDTLERSIAKLRAFKGVALSSFGGEGRERRPFKLAPFPLFLPVN